MMKLSFSRNCSAVDVHEDWPGEGWQTLVERDVRGPRDCAVSQPRGRSELCGETFIKQCIKFSWLSLIFPWVSAEAENTSQSPLLFKTGHIKTFLLCPSFRILLLYQSPQKREKEIEGVSTHDASEAEFERYWLFGRTAAQIGLVSPLTLGWHLLWFTLSYLKTLLSIRWYIFSQEL